jgi:hypothetical protein
MMWVGVALIAVVLGFLVWGIRVMRELDELEHLSGRTLGPLGDVCSEWDPDGDWPPAA